jgi:hypothetical protein
MVAQQGSQLGIHRRQRGRADDHRPIIALRYDAVDVAPALVVEIRVVGPAVRPAALGSQARAARDRLRHDEEIAQLEDQVPARVVGPSAVDADRTPTRPQDGQLGEGIAEVRVLTEDADQPLHRRL